MNNLIPDGNRALSAAYSGHSQGMEVATIRQMALQIQQWALGPTNSNAGAHDEQLIGGAKATISEAATKILQACAGIAQLEGAVRLQEASAISAPAEATKTDSVDQRSGTNSTRSSLTDLAIVKKREADALVRAGRYDDGIFRYSEALTCVQTASTVEHNLGLALLFAHRHCEAASVVQRNFFRHYAIDSSMRKRFSPGPLPQKGTSSLAGASPFSFEDRADQIEYLVAEHRIDPSFRELANRYREIAQEQALDSMRVQDAPLDPARRERLAGYFGRCLHYVDVPRLDGSVLNADRDYVLLEDEYFQNGSVIYFDDFLTPKALAEMQRFVRESTIFFRDSEPSLFVGSYLSEGLNCGLLFQVFEELFERLPRLLNGLSLANSWCFRYSNRGVGNRPHADTGASVTITFWLSPDEGNLDPATGGLVISDQKYPADWDIPTFNSHKDEPWVRSRIAEYLRDAHWRAIPHKCNRAVIFDSALLHKTERFRFDESYVNRRTNLTMIFGTHAELRKLLR